MRWDLPVNCERVPAARRRASGRAGRLLAGHEGCHRQGGLGGAHENSSWPDGSARKLGVSITSRGACPAGESATEQAISERAHTVAAWDRSTAGSTRASGSTGARPPGAAAGGGEGRHPALPSTGLPGTCIGECARGLGTRDRGLIRGIVAGRSDGRSGLGSQRRWRPSSARPQSWRGTWRRWLGRSGEGDRELGGVARRVQVASSADGELVAAVGHESEAAWCLEELPESSLPGCCEELVVAADAFGERAERVDRDGLVALRAGADEEKRVLLGDLGGGIVAEAGGDPEDLALEVHADVFRARGVSGAFAVSVHERGPQAAMGERSRASASAAKAKPSRSSISSAKVL